MLLYDFIAYTICQIVDVALFSKLFHAFGRNIVEPVKQPASPPVTAPVVSVSDPRLTDLTTDSW